MKLTSVSHRTMSALCHGLHEGLMSRVSVPGFLSRVCLLAGVSWVILCHCSVMSTRSKGSNGRRCSLFTLSVRELGNQD